MRLQGERQVRGETLCEDVFSCFREPGSIYDRIGLRRIAPCEDPIGPVVLFFPGVFMNGEIAGNDAKYDLRLYLAQAGLRVWSLDYRTHAVPSTASPKDLEVFDDWTREVFLEDAGVRPQRRSARTAVLGGDRIRRGHGVRRRGP